MVFSLQDTVCDPEMNEHTASKIYSFVKFLFTIFNGFLKSKAIQRNQEINSKTNNSHMLWLISLLRHSAKQVQREETEVKSNV